MAAAVVVYWCGTAGQQVDVDYHTVLEDTLVVFGLEVDTEYDAVVECTLAVASLEVAAECHVGIAALNQ